MRNQSCSSNVNNTISHQPMFTYPCYTTNYHQQPMQTNIPQQQHYQLTAASNQPPSPSINMTHHHLNHQQYPIVKNVVTPMESEAENDFTLVKRKIKKKKIDLTQNQTSSSSSSSPSISTNGSTSSTNTASIISNAKPNNAAHTLNKDIPPGTKYNPIDITQQAKRFAETRYAFPPFILNFKQDVNEEVIIKYLVAYYSTNHDFQLNIAGHRLKQKRDLLIFVDDRESFTMLYDKQKWPATIESLDYDNKLPNHLPPQFSLILRNVPMDIDISLLLNHLKSDYPDVMSAGRIINKNKQSTTLVRIDINNVKIIDELRGPHDANDIRCPDIKSYRAVLTKSLLASAGTTTNQSQQQQQQGHIKYSHNDIDYPLLHSNYRNNYNGNNNTCCNNTVKRIDELFNNMNKLDLNLNRLLDLNNMYSDQLTRIQQASMPLGVKPGNGNRSQATPPTAVACLATLT
ncbi:unnamed protein product [Rotaria sp. Silwood2]|nr:unnamed protein product [Rotaria sp. Silwood2]CAF4400151.1 unnamed protein product [Rotaria sp. Silwood2]